MKSTLLVTIGEKNNPVWEFIPLVLQDLAFLCGFKTCKFNVTNDGKLNLVIFIHVEGDVYSVCKAAAPHIFWWCKPPGALPVA